MSPVRALHYSSLALAHHLKNHQYDLLWESDREDRPSKLVGLPRDLVSITTLPNHHILVARLSAVGRQEIENLRIQAISGELRVSFSAPAGRYDLVMTTSISVELLTRHEISFTLASSLYLDEAPPQMFVLKSDFSMPGENITYVEQVQNQSGRIFMDFGKRVPGSVFYFQNFSALSRYAEDTQVSYTDTVKAGWPDFGFRLPASSEKPLKKGVKYLLSDSFIIYHPNKPQGDHQIASYMLEAESKIYNYIHPDRARSHDVCTLFKKGLQDLMHHKGCWQQVEANAFLNAYVNDYGNPPESMVQLAVLWPAVACNKKYPNPDLENLIDVLTKGLHTFFDEKLKTFVRWIPAKDHLLKPEEEHKKPRVMDSWYLQHPLINLSLILKEVADKSEERYSKLREQFFDSVDFCVKVGRHFNYQWPVFYNIDHLDVLKGEAAPGEGGEKDVAGQYAYLMLRAFSLSQNAKYLEEAKRAARSLGRQNFEVLYQANNTAVAAEALLELWSITDDLSFLRLSEICVCHLLRNTALWEMDYGIAKEYPTFFMLFPLKGAPYAAVFEEHECVASFNRFLQMAYRLEAPLAREIYALLPEYIKYALDRLPYYYPPTLPKNILATEVKTGYLDKSLWIPVEDLGDGWKEAGAVGQEVYGAGAIFTAMADHVHPLDSEVDLIFVSYPILDLRRQSKSVSFRIAGVEAYKAAVRLIGNSETKYEVYIDNQKEFQLDKELNAVEIHGGKQVTIKWK